MSMIHELCEGRSVFPFFSLLVGRLSYTKVNPLADVLISGYMSPCGWTGHSSHYECLGIRKWADHYFFWSRREN